MATHHLMLTPSQPAIHLDEFLPTPTPSVLFFREIAICYLTFSDINNRLILLIVCMDIRRIMFRWSTIHANYNPVEH